MIYYPYNLEYKNSAIQVHFFFIKFTMSLPVKICTADTWQLTIQQKTKQYFLFLYFSKQNSLSKIKRLSQSPLESLILTAQSLNQQNGWEKHVMNLDWGLDLLGFMV